jgi:hypothetical protein
MTILLELQRGLVIGIVADAVGLETSSRTAMPHLQFYLKLQLTGVPFVLAIHVFISRYGQTINWLAL